MKIEIRGGRVFDPANGVDGEVRSICIDGGVIVDPAARPPGDPWRPERVLDAAGRVVMPGGVDVHCHIAGSSINRGRKLLAEEGSRDSVPADPARGLRGGSGGLAPSTFVTGYRYSALGYTTAVDAAVAPSGARQARLELADTPNLDAGYLLLLADHPLILEAIARVDAVALRAAAGELLRRSGALGLKIVNPGGPVRWRRGGKDVEGLDDAAGPLGLTPRAILLALAGAAEDLRLPHPAHVHLNRLGLAGNVETTLASLRALDGRRAHLAHLQFHAYGSDTGGLHRSGAALVCEELARRPAITADVGQVVFGPALTLSADGPLEALLWKLTGSRHVNIDSELEAGCGLVPIDYRPRSFVHALQWAVGMELLLLSPDPWRLVLSTDHPNGGSFLSYPRIIACLMSRDRRREEAKRANPKAIEGTAMAAATEGISREYTLGEIATITRAAPARILGLASKGHLGPGGDGDVTVYNEDPDRERMFSSPRWVLKAGRVVVDDGDLREPVEGTTLRARAPEDPRGIQDVDDWLRRHGSIHPIQSGLAPEELAAMREIVRPSSGSTGKS